MRLSCTIRQFIERAHIDALTYVGDVIAVVRRETVVILRRPSVLRSVRVADAVRPHVLRAQRESAGEAAVQQNLQSVKVINSAAGLGINFGKTVGYRGPVYHAKLAHRGPHAGSGVHHYTDDLVGYAAQEEVPALSAHIPDRQYRVTRQLLLDIGRVLQNLFRDLISGQVRARLVLEVGIVDVVIRKDCLCAQRVRIQRTAADGPVDAIVLRRLRLRLANAGAVEIASANAENGFIRILLRRPAQSQARSEVRGPHRVPVPGVVRNDGGGRHIEPYYLVIDLVQWTVVFIAQTVVKSQIGFDLPLILGITDVIRLPHDQHSRLTGEWA